MAPFTFRRQLSIEWAHCDPAGIVFNPRFFEFFDTSTWLLLEAALGIEKAAMYAHYGIFGVPAVDTGANFMRPVKFGDTIEIVSHIAGVRRASFSVKHQMLNGGQLSVEADETRVWTVRRKDDPDRIAAAPIPHEVLARLGLEPAGAV